jgi:hypothetical protein
MQDRCDQARSHHQGQGVCTYFVIRDLIESFVIVISIFSFAAKLDSNMPSDEKSTKHHDESDSDEEEELEIAPKIDIDVSKLTPLSPEVISKQVSPGSLSPFALVLRNTPRLLSTLVRPKFVLPSIAVCSRISLGCRHNRPCRTRQIDSGQGNIGGHDRALQERARAEYHDQAGLRQREGACSLSLARARALPPPPSGNGAIAPRGPS